MGCIESFLEMLKINGKIINSTKEIIDFSFSWKLVEFMMLCKILLVCIINKLKQYLKDTWIVVEWMYIIDFNYKNHQHHRQLLVVFLSLKTLFCGEKQCFGK